MYKVYLIACSLSLVAANPIVQRIPIPVPGQTCPLPTCTSCPAQTCPNTSRPACQTCQNPYQSIFTSPTMILRQPSNNCPCNKPVTVQSALANQPITQEALTQLILRKLLSPPPQLAVQNPPLKVCNECELEAKKPAPNIINNYIIIPPEFFKANETRVRVEDRTREGKRRRKPNRRRNEETEKCSCDDKDVVDHADENVNSKQNKPPCPCDMEEITETMASINKQDSDIRNTSEVKDEPVNNTLVPTNIDTNLNNRDKMYSNKNTPNNEENIRKTEYTEPERNKPKQKHRIRTKNIEQAIIRDFCKRHPTIPEEIARSLLKNLIKHVESQGNLPYRPYPSMPNDRNDYYPPIIYPENEESELIPTRRRKSGRGSRRRKPHRSGRRHQKPKEELKELSDDCDQKCDKIIAANPSVLNIETETITTEKITATTKNKINENVPIKNSETQAEAPDELIDQLEQIKERFSKLNEIETTTVNYNKYIESFPELGREHKVPTVYRNEVDDYYPDFKNDHIDFYTSDEDCDINQVKYHYTTDRNGETNCKRYGTNTKQQPIINNSNLKVNSNKEENGSECSVSIPPDADDSYEEPTGDSSEEIHFRPPPHLELPDFVTKQINKYSKQINEEFVTDDFEPRVPEIEMKPAKVFTKDKTGRTNIETVYGNSKVVRYGQDEQGAASDPVITYYLPEEAMTEDRIQLPDGETAVVVAKSIWDLADTWETM